MLKDASGVVNEILIGKFTSSELAEPKSGKDLANFNHIQTALF